jgi:hypothetical protein
VVDLNKTYLFRMLHIDNVNHILECGLTKVDSPNGNPHYRSIGDNSLINNRNFHFLPNGNALGNYIPFYFWYRMPMLYVIQKGFNGVLSTLPENIIYCVTSVEKIINLELPFVFTDGHAVNALSSIYESKEIDKLDDIVDFTAIKDSYWVDPKDLDKKRRKEAEFLVENDIPISALLAFVVYNQNAKDKLLQLGINSETIHIRSQYYF